jgi:glutamate synthase (NADPH/NADH) large chain
VAGLDVRGIRSARVDLTFAPSRDLSSALDRIRRRARQAISDGHEVLVLTDRAAGPDRLPVPSLLAVGAVHHDLIRAERRTRAGLVLDSGQPCLVHHFCTLLGYGADAVYPRLAFRSVRALANAGDALGPPAAALDRYVEALEQGLLKVMAKMGISTLESYKGAQAFEAVGLDGALIDAHFTGTASRLGGASLPEIEADLRERHAAAYRARRGGAPALATGGDHYWRRDGEHHRWNPRTIGRLQQAVRNGDRAAYDAYAEAANAATPDRQKLRGRLAFDAGPGDAIPVEDVEPAGEIVRRFFTSSMSFGSLSPEAHETLAVAMNRIGGRASTGEGGEQADRFGTERECAIKQVASGRFGVTSAYLESARCIEIKMAQGSKPGEGGHLPGEKVNEAIARTRCTTPGVSLISPPPHHDIYSIEDLAQLIHDLKRASPEAEVHVKLVASAGIGVIAAGVAKAKADAILVSGRSGGTGASPKTSIKSAGLPWELGLSEVQRVLRRTKLRSRVRLRVDGGLMTGRDVAVAALMGAERFGFGTAALVALGCVMLRKCHCNTCSVGIATQDASLRERFAGRPEHVVRFMHFVAEELREIMARLGVRSVDAMVGRTDRLKPAGPDEPSGDGRGAAARLDPSPLVGAPAGSHPTRKTREQDGPGGGGLAAALIEAARPALEHGTAVHIERPVTNRDRAVGARLSAEVSRRHGGDGLPAGTIRVSLTGVAGQSLGAFLAPGITLALEGEANDYVGKGLSGGHLAVRTPASAGYDPAESVLLGNVALYGATQGQAYVNGRAGERFAVRNSGVRAVVEGVGDHGCEYMTGGAVVVLGPTGRNFGAGMSGGEAYVLDADGTLEDRINPGMVHLEPLEDARDRRLVRRLVECHWHHTGSAQARRTLDRWDEACSRFRKVMPDAFAQKVRAGLEAGTDLRPPIPDPPPHARSAAA